MIASIYNMRFASFVCIIVFHSRGMNLLILIDVYVISTICGDTLFHDLGIKFAHAPLYYRSILVHVTVLLVYGHENMVSMTCYTISDY